MQYIPFSMVKAIHEQTHSAMPNAPLRPYVPKRHPIRDAVNRWRARRTPPKAELQLVCQAELRDRGTTPEGVARAC
ncbi:hypothetical protein [Kribbella jejuensis]|uniref:hypothetical protein n=1 Tax=Kribbella jejuensis TaxID=236068 RepID=UPI001154CFC8|nr:hypothetical protein [Kribbella jejuensis]